MFGRLGEENIPEEGQVPATAAEEDVLGKIWLELVEFGDADLGDSVAEIFLRMRSLIISLAPVFLVSIGECLRSTFVLNFDRSFRLGSDIVLRSGKSSPFVGIIFLFARITSCKWRFTAAEAFADCCSVSFALKIIKNGFLMSFYRLGIILNKAPF